MMMFIGIRQFVLVATVWMGLAPSGLPGAGGVSTRGTWAGGAGGGSHAWVVLPDPNPKNQEAAMLAHIAPRSGGAAGAGAADGVLFPAVRLEKMALGIAACDDRVYMFFDPAADRDAGSLEVLSVRALATPMAGMYAYEPRGRLEAHSSLPRLGGYVGTVGTAYGPVAVVRGEGEPELVVSLLRDGEWAREQSPEVAGEFGVDLSRPLRVMSVEGRAWIVGYTGRGAWGAWTSTDAGREAGKVSLGSWSFRPFAAAPFDVSAAQVAGIGPLIVATVQKGSVLELWSEVGSRWVKLGEHGSVDDRYGLTWLEDVGRAVVVWEDVPQELNAATGSSQPGPAGVKVWEVSVATGLVMHKGEAARRGPLSTQDFRALVVLLVGATTAVLLFVVRVGEDSGVLTLPPGVSLAATGRRVAASAMDVSIALAGVWIVTGASPPEVMDVLKLTPGGMGVMGLVDVVVFGFVGGTVCEGIFGRTIGKVVAGCEVLPVAGSETVDRRGLGLGRAAIRNAVKWALPPAALLGLFEPGGRHRGDVAGRTVVVERFETDEVEGG